MQIPMSEEAGLAYGFVAPNGVSYMWVRMAFGVKGACTHYQLQGERAVFDCLDFTVVYVDNNLVHSNDVDEHIEQCKKVVRCLTKAGLKINLDKTNISITANWAN